MRRTGLPDFAADTTPRPVRSKHGLSASVVAQHQFGVCPLCGVESVLVIDHDHGLARRHGHREDRGCPRCVRAAICDPCNRMLGAARDSVPTLQAAISYLLAWEAKVGR